MQQQLDILTFESWKTLDNKFKKYDEKNPGVWEKFKELTFYLIGKGRKHYGAKGVFERMRWYFEFEVKSDGFKLNNNYTSRYVRKFEKEFPEYKDFFFKRELRS